MVAVTPDGRRVFTVGSDKTARLWDVRSGQEIRRFTAEANEVTCGALSRDGRLGACGTQELPQGSQILIWDLETGRQVQRIVNPADGTRCLLFSPDGRRIYSGDGGRGFVGRSSYEWVNTVAHRWEIATGAHSQLYSLHWSVITGLALSPDGRHLATCGQDLCIRIWDEASGRLQRLIESHWYYTDIVYTPDGTTLLTGAADCCLGVWSASLRPVTDTDARLHGHRMPVTDVDISPDGRQAVTASLDGTIRLWDVAARQEIHRFEVKDPDEQVTSVAFFPDGRRIISGQSSGDDTVSCSVRVWDLPR
jgi:WD40 repeat protein